MSAVLMETFQDLITLALKNGGVIGSGQTASAEDSNDCCQMLNAMLGQWQRRRYLIYHLVDLATPATGAQSYTIGPAGDFTCATRPAAIKAAYARQTVSSNPNQIDYPIQILPSRETYSQIALKSLQSFPQWLWYDAAMPQGNVFFYPVVSSQFELHVVVEEQLQRVTNLTDQMLLPDEYAEAMLYNLAVRISANFATPLNPVVPALAKAGMETIRVSNAQIPIMRLSKFLRRGSRYNFFSDSSYGNR